MPRSVLTAALAITMGLAGCGELNDALEDTCAETNVNTTLAIESPAAGTAANAGDRVGVAFSYSSRWLYDTLAVLANDTVICQQLSPGARARGTCDWDTNALEPGDYRLTLRASDRGPTNVCAARTSPEVLLRLLAAPPVITVQPASIAVAQDATATFSVAVRGSGPISYQWQRSDDAGVNYFDVASASSSDFVVAPSRLADDNAYFRVLVGNSVGALHSAPAILTVIPGVCPTPPMPASYDTSAPPAIAGSASYAVNLLNDPGFEAAVRVGFAPDGFGYWRFDQSVSVPAQQGIAPRTALGGTRMLHFVGTGRSDSVRGSSAEQVQLVDVSALATDIDADLVKVDASVWLSRVVGCTQTDDAMGVQVMAFNGAPTSFAARWTNGINAAVAQGRSRDDADVSAADAWLRHRTAQILHSDPADKAGDAFVWRQASASMNLPPGTRFLAISVYAFENRFNDDVFPELHGHYADDAAVVLSRR